MLSLKFVFPGSCGGFIDLAKSQEQEIIYTVPSEARQRDSICLWIVSTGRKGSGGLIEATILDSPSAQFNSSSDIIFVNYNFTISNSSRQTL